MPKINNNDYYIKYNIFNNQVIIERV